VSRLTRILLLAALLSSVMGGQPARATARVSCSTPLRLYDGTYLSGTTVAIYTRGAWINLGSYGMDNMTSSFKVGACSVSLAAGTGGGGSHYSECLYANCIENVMATGWNNVISSVYIH
jgi:hypothetical protein